VDWRIKGAIQLALGYMPFGAEIHRRLQRRGGVARFEKECEVKVSDWHTIMEYLATVKVPVAGATMVEIGSGWYPTLPLCFYLGGARRIHTYDKTRHLDLTLTRWLARHIRTAQLPLIASALDKRESELVEMLNAFEDGLDRTGSIAGATQGVIDYHAPADAMQTQLPSESVDIVFSNSVLEHIPKNIIEGLFEEAMRILKPGGIVMHAVNCGDHYAYTDPSITQVNYLQFTEEQWALWNNDFQYQNRLRAKEFVAMAERAGFTIELDVRPLRADRLAQLATMQVAPEFAGYTRDELAATTVDFVGRK
jgi:SAM-dependent methyltransferase